MDDSTASEYLMDVSSPVVENSRGTDSASTVPSVERGNSSPAGSADSNSDGFVEMKDEFHDAPEPVTTTTDADAPVEFVSSLHGYAAAAVSAEDVSSPPLPDEPLDLAKYSTPQKTPPMIDGRTMVRPSKPRNCFPDFSPILSDQQPVHSNNSNSNTAEACEAKNSTFVKDGEATENTTFTAVPDAASPKQEESVSRTAPTVPAHRVLPYENTQKTVSPQKRDRQKTVVVHSVHAEVLRSVFNGIKSMDDVFDAQQRSLAVIANMEKEHNSKLARLNEECKRANTQYEYCMMGYQGTLEALEMSIQKSGFNGQTRDDGSEALRKMRDEKKTIEMEYDRMTEAYKTLFNYSEQLKIMNKCLKEEVDERRCVEEQLKTEVKSCQSRYDRMVANAREKLNSANDTINVLRTQCDEDTKGLRLAVRTKDAQLASLNQQLEIKVKENVELNDICQQLLQRCSVDNSTDEEC